jgi:hypothetical protein
VLTQPNPQPADPSALATTLNDMITGLRKTQLLYVAAKLGIADLLQEGAKSGSVLDVEMATLDKQSKGIAIHK